MIGWTKAVTFFDSEDLRFGVNITGSCTLLQYDPAAKTAHFLMTLSSQDGRPLPEGRFTFSADELLTQKSERAALISQNFLDYVNSSPTIQQIDDEHIRGWGSPDGSEPPDMGYALTPTLSSPHRRSRSRPSASGMGCSIFKAIMRISRKRTITAFYR